MHYFSDQELGNQARNHEVIPLSVWGGIVGLINKHKSDGFLGCGFPADCQDDKGVIGCHVPNFNLALNAEIPKLNGRLDPSHLPDTLTILDLIQFCHKNIGKPIQGNWHAFFEHYHYNGFDVEEGRRIFREEAEALFVRNGIAFKINEDGSVIRTISNVLMSAITVSNFNTGDQTLNDLLNEACMKFLNPNPIIRREGLERLWDSWERLKTIEPGKDKKEMVANLLNRTCSQEQFRNVLNEEGEDLTRIGNNFRIRHTETTKAELPGQPHIDYLFHRLFALIELVLKMTNRCN